MSDKLKKFVSEHRQEFDNGEPAKGLWEKIDAKRAAKNSSGISSKWLSMFKYLSLSASILLVVYFIAKNLNSFSENEPSLSKKNAENITHDQNRSESIGNTAKKANDPSAGKNESQGLKLASAKSKQDVSPVRQKSWSKKEDSVLSEKYFANNPPDEKKIRPESSGPLSGETAKPGVNSANEKKDINFEKNKKAKIYIPGEPEQMNSYSGTLYEGSSFRAMLRAYKFPGKFTMNNDGFTTLRTISCTRLEKIPNVKAVWIKGKTNKEMVVSIKRGFKNVILLKSDGRKLKPEAISHYYKGLTVISEYKGRFLNLLFNDKVELILFFKDVESGDKVIIDGTIEAMVNNAP